VNSEEKDTLREEREETTPLSPLSPGDDEVQNILDRLCASFAEESTDAVSEEVTLPESDGEALSEELQMLRLAVEGVKSALSGDAEEAEVQPFAKAEEEADETEDELEASDNSEIEDMENEDEEDAPAVSVLPPVTETEEAPLSDGVTDDTPYITEATEASDFEIEETLAETVSEEKEEESSLQLPSFDEEDELFAGREEEEASLTEDNVDTPSVPCALSEEDAEDTPIVLRTPIVSEPVVSAVPPSNRPYGDEDEEEPKVPDQAYRYYEPSPIDTAEVEDRLASFRHGYQKYIYTGVLEEEPEPIPERVEEKKEEETILSLFAETPLPASSVTEDEPVSLAEEAIAEELADEAPTESFFEEVESVFGAEEAPIFSPALEDTVVSFPPVEEAPIEAEEMLSSEEEDEALPVTETEATPSVSKVYPEHNGFMEDVFGAVSASDLDAERERLLDDTVIPEEIVSPEPFNADDYVISDRSIGEGMVSGESTREYLSYNQNEDILQGYRTRIRFCTVKLVLVSFLTALLLVTENAFLFGWTIPAFGDGLGVRGLPVLLNLQLLLLVVALSLPIFVRGITILKSKKFCTETNAVALSVIAIVYDVVLYLTDMPSPRMFSFCAALYLTFCHIFEIVKTNGDFMTFQVVSSAAKKTVAVTAALGNFPDESSALSEFSLSDEAPLSEMRRAGFVEGFFSRSTDRGGDDIHIVTVLLALIFALASFALSFFLNTSASIVEHFYVFALSFTATVPVAATFTRRIPFGEAIKKAVLADAAIVGEASAAEFASTEVFALDDIVAFPSRNVKVKGFKLFGENRLDRVICRVTALFAKLGGPLAGVFGSAGNGGPTVDDVAVLDVTKNGITARLDGDSFLVGNGEFMEQHHVTLYYDSEDARQIESGKISIMYVAENGVIAARFYLQYIPNPAFEKTVERLSEENIAVVLRTFDPNVTDALLKRVSYIGERQVRVVHRDASALDEDKKPRLNSGIVTTGAPGTLLPVLYRSIKLGRVFRYGRVINLLAAALSVTVSAVLLALGQFSLLSSAFVGIYQAFWLIPTVLVTKFCLKE